MSGPRRFERAVHLLERGVRLREIQARELTRAGGANPEEKADNRGRAELLQQEANELRDAIVALLHQAVGGDETGAKEERGEG